ncbi:hypothetical protein [Clostridium formicaceticum]|uniref:Uncharacterized protein n=1 Tax=Clostridium formicaceticum TaxID=1497 RepID=A0AAC9RLC7_9CLOT|nr:hypothetical protein [Clostridium formicaceticum]AOY76695.1 hypothetical protein BJL90_12955 [Clostridium formicaceticum]ARE87128.1 hypothetical protein CLFO_15140 [Clostridium formicaceticum]
MIEKITLDMLKQDSVSVKRQQYIIHEGIEYPIGEPHRKAYVNNERDRQEAQNELPEAQQKAVFAVWGDTPTVDEAVTE